MNTPPTDCMKSESGPYSLFTKFEKNGDDRHAELLSTLIFRRLTYPDLYKMNNINLDTWTENFVPSFYLTYLSMWPECCILAESLDGMPVGYVIGKMEGEDSEWHGHVSALSISPDWRGSGVGAELMRRLERVCAALDCPFIDLFVRPSNASAVTFYRHLSYTMYRVVPEYYSGIEDAYDMRKPLTIKDEGGEVG